MRKLGTRKNRMSWRRMGQILLLSGGMLALVVSAGSDQRKDIRQTAEGKQEEIKENGQKRADEVTLTWFVAVPEYRKEWNPKKNLADAKILERTGVNLDIVSGDLSDLDALIATDSLPDLITLETGASQRLLLENTGMVLQLDALFEKYAPDVNIPDSMREWYRNQDGGWYSVVSYYYGPERVNEEFGGYLGTHNNNYVRRDLLGEIGMNAVELHTKEGLLTALKKASALTYEGQAVIPFAGWWTENIAEQFGMERQNEDGTLACMQEQPEWLEALLFGNQLYREGLLLPEDFTVSANQRRKQVQAGRVFFTNGYSNVKDARDALYSHDPKAQYAEVGFINGDQGKTPKLKSVPSGGWTATLVNAKTTKAETIAQFISYMTKEEATLDAAPGIGTGTYMIEDGICSRKPAVSQEFEADYTAASEKYYANLEFFVDWTIVQKYQDNSRAADYRMIRSKKIIIYDCKAYDAAQTLDGSSKMGEIKERIEAYYKQAEVEILTADSEEQCRELYEYALEQMEQMGLKQLLAFENQQYQEVKAKIQETE